MGSSFAVRMADQRRVQPLGLIRGLKMEVCGMKFDIAAVILHMEDISGSYPLLLERPWLRQARVKQDWQSDRITIRKRIQNPIHQECQVLRAKTTNNKGNSNSNKGC